MDSERFKVTKVPLAGENNGATASSSSSPPEGNTSGITLKAFNFIRRASRANVPLDNNKNDSRKFSLAQLTK